MQLGLISGARYNTESIGPTGRQKGGPSDAHSAFRGAILLARSIAILDYQ